MSSTNTVDLELLEKEINAKFSNNPEYNIDDLQLFVELTPYSYIPIKTLRDSSNKIYVEPNEHIVGMNVFMGSKHQFIHKQFVNEFGDIYSIELGEEFKTAYDATKFLIFQNGYLMNNSLFTFIIPNFNNSYLKKKIFSTAVFKQDAIIDIFYIENDDFIDVKTSRDFYLKGVKYIARNNDDRVITIPYPNKNMEHDENRFFIFNDKGRILDLRSDYVLSNDGKYITLIGNNKLNRANINYIVFAFMQLPSSPDFIADDYFDEEDGSGGNSAEEFETLSGSPIFQYAFSIEEDKSEIDRSGVVKFSPEFKDYTLTKTNFILFGNGVWIDPDRYDIYNNNSIVFRYEKDIMNIYTTHYTMVILGDTTNHLDFQIPGKYLLMKIVSNEEKQNYYILPEDVDYYLYSSFLLFKGSLLIPSEYYEYDDIAGTIELTYPIDFVEEDRSLNIVFLASNVNNTKQEALFKQFTFPCSPQPYEGTPLPRLMKSQTWDKDYMMLFLNGRYLRHTEYDIIDDIIYIDNNFFADVSGELYPLDDHTFTAVVLEGMYKYDQKLLSNSKIRQIEEKKTELKEAAQGGAIFIHRTNFPVNASGIVHFYPSFDDYTITSRHQLVFFDKKLLTTDRYAVRDNNTILPFNDIDKTNIRNIEIDHVILTDSLKDDKFNPTTFYTKIISATEDGQTIFNLPAVNIRYQTFIMFDTDGNFISKYKSYRINDVDNTVEFIDRTCSIYESYVLIYIDSYAREKQDSKLVQFTFPCNTSGTTRLPGNLYYPEFDNKYMLLFLNNEYISPSHYSINGNELYLDSTINLDPTKEYIYTAVWIITTLIELNEYEYTVPSLPMYPYQNRIGMCTENAYFTFSYSIPREETDLPATTNGILKFSPKFSEFNLTKSNTLMFSSGRWVHPDIYELYSNEVVFFTKFAERMKFNDTRYTIVVFSDNVIRTSMVAPPFFVIKEVEITEDGMMSVNIPPMASDFMSFIVFYKEKILALTDKTKYRVDNIFRRIIFLEPELEKDEKLYFVFLNASSSLGQTTVFLQETVSYNGNTAYLPTSTFIETGFDSKYLLVFIDGQFIHPDEYTIENNILTTNPDISITGSTITAVYLVSYVANDEIDEIISHKPDGIKDGFLLEYSYSVEKPIEERADIGLIHFTPSFADYTLDKSNFLLFGRGAWIAPTRYEVLTNGIIQFLDAEDIETADWAHYTMAILSEAVPKDADYHPVSFSVRAVKATQNNQNVFDIPYMGDKSTFLVFKGSQLLPLTNEERIVVNEEENKIVLRDPEDAVEKGRALFFVFLNDSSTNDDRIPIFIQETVMAAPDPNTGTLMPSIWFKNTMTDFYNKYMMLFLGGMYLSPAQYDIVDNRIYLKETYHDLLLGPDAFTLRNRYYTCVIISSYQEEDLSMESEGGAPSQEEIPNTEIIEEDDYQYDPDRVVPEDDDTEVEGLMFEFYQSDDLPVETRDELEYIQFRDTFSDYALESSNFLLFDNSLWVDPERYEILDNHSIHVHDDIDKEAANWSHSTMVVVHNKQAYDLYGAAYIKPIFKFVRVKIDDINRIDYPTMENTYQSFMVFYNGRILPIFDEKRYYIDEVSHVIEIKNIDDYMEIGNYVTYVFLNSESNTGQDIVLTQESFKCTGDETVIPKSIYLYEDQRFSKKRLLLFINGTYVAPERYRIHNNRIYMVDYMPSKNPYTFTMVYIIMYEDPDAGDIEEVIEETFERPLDDIIFERAYIKPYVEIPFHATDKKYNNNLIFNFSYEEKSSINGFVQFNPAFSKYKLFKNNIIMLVNNGKYLHPSKFSLLTNDTISFPLIDAEEVAQYNDFNMIIMADAGNYPRGFSASKVVHQEVICSEYAENTFDIMVQSNWVDAKSFIVFGKDSKLLTNYEIDWKRKQLYILDPEDELDPGDALYFVYLDSKFTNYEKYNVWTQVTFNLSDEVTPLPDKLKNISENKFMVFLDREYLQPSMYNIYGNRIQIAIPYDTETPHKITCVAIVDSDLSYAESEDRIIKR